MSQPEKANKITEFEVRKIDTTDDNEIQFRQIFDQREEILRHGSLIKRTIQNKNGTQQQEGIIGQYYETIKDPRNQDNQIPVYVGEFDEDSNPTGNHFTISESSVEIINYDPAGKFSKISYKFFPNSENIDFNIRKESVQESLLTLDVNSLGIYLEEIVIKPEKFEQDVKFKLLNPYKISIETGEVERANNQTLSIEIDENNRAEYKLPTEDAITKNGIGWYLSLESHLRKIAIQDSIINQDLLYIIDLENYLREVKTEHIEGEITYYKFREGRLTSFIHSRDSITRKNKSSDKISLTAVIDSKEEFLYYLLKQEVVTKGIEQPDLNTIDRMSIKIYPINQDSPMDIMHNVAQIFINNPSESGLTFPEHIIEFLNNGNYVYYKLGNFEPIYIGEISNEEIYSANRNSFRNTTTTLKLNKFSALDDGSGYYYELDFTNSEKPLTMVDFNMDNNTPNIESNGKVSTNTETFAMSSNNSIRRLVTTNDLTGIYNRENKTKISSSEITNQSRYKIRHTIDGDIFEYLELRDPAKNYSQKELKLERTESGKPNLIVYSEALKSEKVAAKLDLGERGFSQSSSIMEAERKSPVLNFTIKSDIENENRSLLVSITKVLEATEISYQIVETYSRYDKNTQKIHTPVFSLRKLKEMLGHTDEKEWSKSLETSYTTFKKRTNRNDFGELIFIYDLFFNGDVSQSNNTNNLITIMFEEVLPEIFE